MENKTYLYGASGHGKVVLDILQCNGIAVTAIVDDNPKTAIMAGVPVSKPGQFSSDDRVLLSIGTNAVRKKLSAMDVDFVSAVHPSAVIANSAAIGVGTVIMAGALVNPDAVIGKHCIVNTGAIIEHDCEISDFCHISPGVHLAGNVTVEEGSHVGIGASVIQGVHIGKWATVGAGAVILNDIPDYAVVVGNPGKIIKYNDAK